MTGNGGSGTETSLIDRYVREVGRNLPATIRGEVDAELRASLQETVEARLATAGATEPAQGKERAASREAIELALLKEMGRPEDLALTYLPRTSYLIGPELHGGFMATLKICLGLLTVLFFIGLASNFGGLMSGPSTFAKLIVEAVSEFLESGLKVFAVIVLIFAAIEWAAMPKPAASTKSRAAPKSAPAAELVAAAESEWKPEALPEADDGENISRSHAAFRIGFILFGLVVLNLFPHWLGVWVVTGDESGVMPLLGAGFDRWLWLLNWSLAASLAVNLLLLRARRWSVGTRLLDVGSDLLGLVWIYNLAQETDVLSVDPDGMMELGWSIDAAERLTHLIEGPLGSVIQIGLWIGVLGAAVGVLATLGRLWRTARR